MSLAGTFSTMPLTDLLQWLGMAGKTGVLVVRRSSLSKKLYLEGGNLIATASADPNEMLGQFLLARGLISEEELREGLRAQETSRIFLGRILVRAGALQEDQLRLALAQKAEETVYSLFEWDDADFEFLEDGTPDEHTLPLSLKMDDLVLRGVQRYDEMLRIREVIPDGRVILQRTETEVPERVLSHPLASRILERLEHGRRIDEIALDLHASRFQVMKFLFECQRSGLVEAAPERAEPPARPVPPVPATPDTMQTLLDRARERLEEGDSEVAMALLEEVLAAVPGDRTARGLLERSEEEFLEQTYHSLLPPDDIPELCRPLEELVNETLRPEEFYLLSRVDGLWEIRSIVDIAPMREVDAVRVLKRLLQRRVIRLRSPGEDAAAVSSSRSR